MPRLKLARQKPPTFTEERIEWTESTFPGVFLSPAQFHRRRSRAKGKLALADTIRLERHDCPEARRALVSALLDLLGEDLVELVLGVLEGAGRK